MSNVKYISRRMFVQRSLSLAALGGAPAWASEQSPVLNVLPLNDRMWLISGAGSNVLLFNSPQGVLLVDGGLQSHSAALLAKVKQLTSQSPIHTLINTHWHREQTGLNLLLGKQGTRIIAHENTRLSLSTTIDCKWRNRRFEPLAKAALPNHTFYTKETFSFGGEQIECGHLFQAHTDGDLYVYFRDANVVCVGDVLSGSYPIADYTTHGWIGGMIDATKTLSALCNDQTRVIAATGPVQNKQDLEREQTMLSTMKTRLSKLLAQGKSAQEMIDAAPSKDFDAQWGDPKLFIETTWRGLIPRARELGVSIV